jgi:hypothetical protein
MFDYIGKQIKLLSSMVIDFYRPYFDNKAVDDLPDGGFFIRESNKKRLSYNMQINDNKYWQYHRNNGITLIGVKEPGKSHTYYKLQTVEGALSTSNILNRAYIT